MAQPSEPTPRTPQSRPVSTETDPSLVSKVLEVLAVGAAVDATSVGIAKLLRVNWRSVALVLGTLIGWQPDTTYSKLGSAMPIERDQLIGPVSTMVATQNQLRQAAYVVNAARRVQAQVDAGVPRELAVEKERRIYWQHRAASDRRLVVAVRIDTAANTFGNELGWYAVVDGRTDSKCKQANGGNFSALRMPQIGWPGTVHPRCRCTPGPPHPGGKMLV